MAIYFELLLPLYKQNFKKVNFYKIYATLQGQALLYKYKKNKGVTFGAMEWIACR
jgi:hypothetical protein